MASNYYIKRVEQGQDIYDLCIQEYGGIRAIYLLLADNPSLDLIRALEAGEYIRFRVEPPDTVPIDRNTMDFFRVQEIRVNMQEKELLVDGAYNTPTGGPADGALPDLTPIGAGGVSSTTITGIQTASGAAIRTSNGQLITLRRPPVLIAATGQTLLTASGAGLQIHRPHLNYIQAAAGEYLITANGQYLLFN